MNVVFGANGRAGGETAKALLAAGAPVRVVLRRPEKAAAWLAKGARVAFADMEDVDAVNKALEGASAAFLLIPPPVSGDPYRRTVVLGSALGNSARRAGLRKAVVLSSIGAQHASGTGVISTLHQLENLLSDIAPSIAFLRPGYYVEAWSEVLDSILHQSALPTFVDSDLKIPMVSTLDVGKTAAALMKQEWSGLRVIELSGPDDWSPRDVARAFSTKLNRPVLPAFVPVSERAGILQSAGVPEIVATALLGMYAGIADGRVAREGGREELRGETSLELAVARLLDNTATHPHLG